MSITEKRLAEIKAFKNTDFSDCPPLTEEKMKEFKPSHLRPQGPAAQAPVSVQLDADVLNWLKSAGEGYQTRVNAILREAMLRTV
jgi:uncharacterized protein (DUF4415 family)